MSSSILFSTLLIIGIIAFVYIEISQKIQYDRLMRQHWREEKAEMLRELRDDRKEQHEANIIQRQQMFDDRQKEKELRFQQRLAEKQHRDAVILSSMATRPIYTHHRHYRHHNRRPIIRQVNRVINNSPKILNHLNRTARRIARHNRRNRRSLRRSMRKRR